MGTISTILSYMGGLGLFIATSVTTIHILCLLSPKFRDGFSKGPMGLRKKPKILVKNHTILNIKEISDTEAWAKTLERSCRCTMKNNGQIDKAWKTHEVTVNSIAP